MDELLFIFREAHMAHFIEVATHEELFKENRGASSVSRPGPSARMVLGCLMHVHWVCLMICNSR